jgi:hypothetical protein
MCTPLHYVFNVHNNQSLKQNYDSENCRKVFQYYVNIHISFYLVNIKLAAACYSKIKVKNKTTIIL